MAEDKPFIHLFRTPGGYYIYDVNTNGIIKTEKTIYDILAAQQQDNMSGEIDEAAAEKICKLKKRGFLSGKKPVEMVHQANDLLPYFLSSKVKMVILQITQQCNLRCSYCVYSGGYYNRIHSPRTMSFQTAQKGIDFLLANSRDVDPVIVGFYGGEPMLQFGLMKQCIEYAEENAEGRKLLFSFTTNGTLMDEKVLTYLVEHNVSMMISLDGPKEIHDKNRRFTQGNGGTFEKITENLELVKGKFPDYLKNIRFSVVLDPETDFSCASEFFTNYETINQSMVSASSINDKYAKKEIRDVGEDFITNRGYETFKFFLAKLNRLDSKMVSRLVVEYYTELKKKMIKLRKPLSVSLPDKFHHSGPCIPGAQRLFIDVEGNFLPCERASEASEVMRIGHIDRGFDLERIREHLNIGKLSEDACRNCWALRFCTQCAVAADNTSELSLQHKLNRCRGVKQSAEEEFKDYCALLELGHQFEDNFVHTGDLQVI